MFALLIVIWCVCGGIAFGSMLIVGAMLYSGKWALPNSQQRRVQRAKIDREVMEHRLETKRMQADMDQVESARAWREVQDSMNLHELEEAAAARRDAAFQRQLEQSKSHP